MSSGFTEFEKMAAAWSRQNKLEEATKCRNVADTDSLRRVARSSNSRDRNSAYRDYSSSRHRKRQSPRYNDSPRRSENYYSKNPPDSQISRVNIENNGSHQFYHRKVAYETESGEIIGRDPAIRGRTLSRSLSPVAKRENSRDRDRNRKSSRSPSDSSGNDKKLKLRSRWTHDKFSRDVSERLDVLRC